MFRKMILKFDPRVPIGTYLPLQSTSTTIMGWLCSLLEILLVR